MHQPANGMAIIETSAAKMRDLAAVIERAREVCTDDLVDISEWSATIVEVAERAELWMREQRVLANRVAQSPMELSLVEEALGRDITNAGKIIETYRGFIVVTP